MRMLKLRLLMMASVFLFFSVSATPAPKRATAARTAKTAKAAKRTRVADYARTHRYHGGYRYYYWYDDDDCHHCDYVQNATCILKVRKKLSDSSGLFEVKCSVGYVSVDRSVRQNADQSLREKQLIRIDGINMQSHRPGDTLYLPSSKNLWYNGEYRDPQGKLYQCYTLNADNAAGSFKQ